ncbi:hypothetical protein JXA85_01385 [Candidatus Woesearchaeota archaeon]|nr:hypothetical protein [Candidatus Woesearchaeota archaeon]
MHLKITKKEEKSLLSHTAVEAELAFEQKTPSRKEITAELAKKMGAKEELISIILVKPAYGYKTAIVKALCYNDEKAKKELEPQWIKNRLEGKKEATTEKKEDSDNKSQNPVASPPENKPEGKE